MSRQRYVTHVFQGCCSYHEYDSHDAMLWSTLDWAAGLCILSSGSCIQIESSFFIRRYAKNFFIHSKSRAYRCNDEKDTPCQCFKDAPRI